MPNTPVRAAAEGMPNLNRRNLLIGAVAISTGVAVATVAPPADAAAVSAGLRSAIEAFRSAEDAYVTCQAKEAAIAETVGEDDLFPKWTPPGGIVSIWAHRPNAFRTSASLEIAIAQKVERIEGSFAAGLMNRAAYERQTRDLAAQGGAGLAFLREREAVVEASGYHEAYRQTDEAYRAFADAFNAVLRHPCKTLDDVRDKASCLLVGYQRLSLPIEGEDLVDCLSSFANREG
jgi:hypothetical protein